MGDKVFFGLLGRIYQGAEKMLVCLLLSGLLVCLPTFANYAATALRGDWADKALSDVLSEKYGCPVTVKNVYLAGWSDIYFSSLHVRRTNGRMLIQSAQGSLHLKNFNFFRKATFETELRLNRVIFFHEYYKDSPTFKPWNQLLQKPFEVQELILRVVQSKEKTLVKILKSASKDMLLDGGISVDASGYLQDSLHVRLSPWMILRAILA